MVQPPFSNESYLSWQGYYKSVSINQPKQVGKSMAAAKMNQALGHICQFGKFAPGPKSTPSGVVKCGVSAQTYYDWQLGPDAWISIWVCSKHADDLKVMDLSEKKDPASWKYKLGTNPSGIVFQQGGVVHHSDHNFFASPPKSGSITISGDQFNKGHFTISGDQFNKGHFTKLLSEYFPDNKPLDQAVPALSLGDRVKFIVADEFGLTVSEFGELLSLGEDPFDDETLCHVLSESGKLREVAKNKIKFAGPVEEEHPF